MVNYRKDSVLIHDSSQRMSMRRDDQGLVDRLQNDEKSSHTQYKVQYLEDWSQWEVMVDGVDADRSIDSNRMVDLMVESIHSLLVDCEDLYSSVDSAESCSA